MDKFEKATNFTLQRRCRKVKVSDLQQKTSDILSNINEPHIKCCTSGTLSSVTVRSVLNFAISSEHEASYAALATALFMYAFSILSIAVIMAYRLAKSSEKANTDAKACQ